VTGPPAGGGGGLGAGDHRQRVLLVVAGVAALLIGGVGGQQHGVGVGQCRPCVLVAPVRVVVGADRGVNVARANARVCVVVSIAPVLVWLSVPLLGSWSVLAHGSSGCVIVVVRSLLSGAPVSAGLRCTVGWRRQLERGGKAGSGFAPGRAGAPAPLARFHRALMPLESHGAAGAEPPARRERRRASPPQWRLTVTGVPAV
jgi:hypothetical protein